MPVIRLVGIGGGGMVEVSWMMCTSSWRTILGGWESPVGCRNRVSGALFLTPGMWSILKQYLRVLSLRFLSLVLLMLSWDLSSNIFRSGWWSTAMNNMSRLV